MLLIKALLLVTLLTISTQVSIESLMEFTLNINEIKAMMDHSKPICSGFWASEADTFSSIECISFSNCQNNITSLNEIWKSTHQPSEANVANYKLNMQTIASENKSPDDKEPLENILVISNPERDSILACTTNPNLMPNLTDLKKLESQSNYSVFRQLSELLHEDSQALENNDNSDSNDMSPFILSSDSSKISQIEAYLQTNICTITKVFSWILAAIVLITIFNIIGAPEISGVFFFISLLQSNNLLAYISYPFASNFTCFYKSLDIFNFQIFLNIPNFILGFFSYENYISKSHSVMFEAYGFSSNWFDNGGKALTPLILLLILLLIVRLLLLVKFGTETFPLMLKDFKEKLVWNGIIRVVQVTFLALLMASLLQFKDVNFVTTVNTLAFAFAVTVCVFLAAFIVNSVRLVRSLNTRERSASAKFEAIYNEYWLDQEVDYITVNFEIFVLVKKFIQLVAIIFIDDYPIVQTVVFVLTECCQGVLLYMKRRYKDKTAGKLITLISVTNFLSLVILCCVFIAEEDSAVGEALGWAIISLSTVLYLVNIGLIIAEQVLVKHKIIDFYQQLCYGLWLSILAVFKCLFWVCIKGRRVYWSRRARRNSRPQITTELVSIQK